MRVMALCETDKNQCGRFAPRVANAALMAVLFLTAAAVAEPLTLEVRRAQADRDQRTREPIVTVAFKDRAKQAAFARLTEQNVGRAMEWRVEGQVVTRHVIREPIFGGSLQISGFSEAEAQALAAKLSAAGATIEVDIAAEQ